MQRVCELKLTIILLQASSFRLDLLALQHHFLAIAVHARTAEHASSLIVATRATVWKDGLVLSARSVSSYTSCHFRVISWLFKHCFMYRHKLTLISLIISINLESCQ
jgi:hypothetical protein